MNKLFTSIFSLYTVQFTNLVLPLLILPYLVSTIGTDNFGMIAFGQALVQYMILATDYGFNFSSTRSISISRSEPIEIAKIFWSTLYAKGIIFLMSFLTFGIALICLPKLNSHWRIFLSLALAALGNLFQSQYFFQGLEKFKTLALVTLICRLAPFPFFFMLVKSQDQTETAALLLSAGPFTAGVCLFTIAVTSKTMIFIPPSLLALKQKFTDGFHLFTSNAAVSLYTNTNPVILGLIATNEAVAYYTAAERIIRVFQGAIGPIGQVIYPKMSLLVHESKTKAVSLAKKVLFIQGSAGFILSIALFFFAELINQLIWKKSLAPAEYTLRILAFIPFVVSLSNVLGIQLMLPLGLSGIFSKIIILSGLINVIVLIPLSFAFNENGAAFAMLMTECTVTSMMFYVLKKQNIL